MNTRIHQVVSRLAQYLTEVPGRSIQYPSPVDFSPRHAEHLAAAGFGFPNFHEYLAALRAGTERCSGYYIPDSAMIERRMAGLGYPPELVRKCTEFFALAVTNGDGYARADLFDDLQGERQFILGSNELANHGMLVRYLQMDVMREESSLWASLAWHGISHDSETEDNLTCAIELPPDFPSHHHLMQTIDVPIVVRYDLDQGEDQEALFYNTNRRMEFRGNLRLKASGRRGWGYPTIRLDATPFVDNRTPEEKEGEYSVHKGPDIDEMEFDEGNDAGRTNMQPSPQASFSFLAGWIMTANEVNSTGHMSTGKIEKAFYGALENAKTISGLNGHEAFHLASQGCRYLASNRIRRALEELLQEASADEKSW